MTKLNKEKIIRAGKISSEVKAYARTIIKKGIPLLEIAEKIESKIIELGGKPAFPTNLSQIGKKVQDTIESYGFSPIINLSGHSIEKNDLHSGLTIPNTDNGQQTPIGLGIRAIEPFATSGSGKIYEGKLSGIYALTDDKNVRSPIAREILFYIAEEYQTLPFCSRWLVNKFGTKALFGIKELERNGNLHQFEQLIEITHKPVAQSEHTLLIEKDGTIITTLKKSLNSSYLNIFVE